MIEKILYVMIGALIMFMLYFITLPGGSPGLTG